jgi:hypothetical protein
MGKRYYSRIGRKKAQSDTISGDAEQNHSLPALPIDSFLQLILYFSDDFSCPLTAQARTQEADNSAND